ncbi:DUF3179 domain-containing protein [Halomonas lysinitropha]|uniref:DUF3179 domain-containing protein n=1 Tax=Halomonas lysinitropha TaxID=2607506 RepID=A0A5K1I7Z6_9GAMM|nr:DUF3179 domain-containing protein [Halomonas lysinitropha]VVZ95202.1 hypothetical protein HALO32_01267 [Halomonas lysinitropha]
MHSRRILVALATLLLASPRVGAGLPTADPPEMPVAHSLAAFRQALQSGGPGKDGIPSIDSPRFQSAVAAEDVLEDNDKVIGLYADGEARAYPQRILVWHEIVNDEVGGKAISVTYCPLTGTALGFERGDTQLGVSGKLVNSNLVMYDHATDSEWPQILGVAIDGPLAGHGLEEFRVFWTTWGAWKARHPDTRVLTEQTGYVRNYQRDPYGSYNPRGGYYLPQSSRLFPVMAGSDRFPPKTEIFGFRTEEGAAAITRDALREETVVEMPLGDSHYTVVHDAGLDTGWVFHNPRRAEVSIDGLRFGPEGVTGAGLEEFERVNAFEAMWFAWTAFYPDTRVYTGEGMP